MGYDSEDAYPVIFDLETVAIDGAATYLEPVTAPANYKDAEKIAAYVADGTAKQLDKAALDLDLCRIVALGWQKTFPKVEVAPIVGTCPLGEIEERAVLRQFWKSVGDQPLLGFNCLAFDLPVLLRRSLYLGVEPRPLTLSKYKHPGIIDLMQMLSFDGLVNYRSLSFYCRRFGLTVPADEHTGADIARLVAEGSWDAVREHCRVDVVKTVALARRIGVLPAGVSV